METLTALSLATSVLQTIDFSSKILSKAGQLRKSCTGVLPENTELEKVVMHLRNLIQELQERNSLPTSTSQTQNHGGAHALISLVNMCIQTAKELLDVLEMLKVRGAKTRWKSFRQAVKSVWTKEKIGDMVNRLELIRGGVEFGVIMGLRDELVTLSSQQITRFDSLDRSSKAVVQAILNGQSASTAASNTQLQALDDMNKGLHYLVVNEHQRTRDVILEEIRQHAAQMFHRQHSSTPTINLGDRAKTDILMILKFHGIEDRNGIIPDAYKKTFEWIWESENPKKRVWDTFWQWLTTGQGIYWVSGNQGSGKSTLMKYIYYDDRISQGLSCWSGPDTQLVTAGFFFWNSGSALQKSLLGLLRSILYKTLRTQPQLIDEVFLAHEQEDIFRRWVNRKSDAETILTLKDVKPAFARLLQVPSLRLCLFIDALDEYEGDHNEVAELFTGIIASPSVKACLSSRPFGVFEQAFSKCPRLRLQDLTYDDITVYVREKLQGGNDILNASLLVTSDFDEIIEEITEKASGVFPWVSLVVRSLLEGIKNGDRMADLRMRLKETPHDLYQLYWHTLHEIRPAFYFEQAAKMLKIAYAAKEMCTELSVDLLLAAEHYAHGKPLVNIFGYHTTEQRNHALTARLYSRCRGLLEVRGDHVVFLHRSVTEFLDRPSVAKTLEETISGQFSPYASLLAGYVSQMKYQDVQGSSSIMLSLARKGEEELGLPHASLMTEFDKIANNSTS
ncbi:hypothetical protein GQ43DRAFT_483523 [Delitschia confertaspora ATCC 74209]|uniref:NACHT domain-containing protein n=1 Tax=Delitschia confertaspora ATCC 74209 TaxID=1513339 RepID=A0A9P4JKH3_9PLEO|nr:hypothetical protein GQ43DRAFT_483523 [Delitschia confertaspora ATCC 74209]